jgi:hypothetical protein
MHGPRAGTTIRVWLHHPTIVLLAEGLKNICRCGGEHSYFEDVYHKDLFALHVGLVANQQADTML